MLIDRSSFQNRNSHRGEVGRINFVMRKSRQVAFRDSLLALLPHFIPLAVITHGHRVGEARRFHSRKRANPLAKLAVETLPARFVESELLHVHREIQNVIGIESDIQLLGVFQAPQEKCRNNQHN